MTHVLHMQQFLASIEFHAEHEKFKKSFEERHKTMTAWALHLRRLSQHTEYYTPAATERLEVNMWVQRFSHAAERPHVPPRKMRPRGNPPEMSHRFQAILSDLNTLWDIHNTLWNMHMTHTTHKRRFLKMKKSLDEKMVYYLHAARLASLASVCGFSMLWVLEVARERQKCRGLI